MSISGTNKSSPMFTPFTGASFINDCLLQPILHVNHPLLQFVDITDPLLSTAALFSRYYSHHGIQTWAIKAALYLGRYLTYNRPLKSAAILIIYCTGRHGVFAGKTVWSMPERFEIYIVYKRRYINTLPFLPFLTCTKFPQQADSERIRHFNGSTSKRVLDLLEMG